MQKECEMLSSLKLELGKFLEKLTVKDDEVKKQDYIFLKFQYSKRIQVNIITNYFKLIF